MKVILTLLSIVALFPLSLGAAAQEMDKIDIYIFKAKIKNVSIVDSKNALYVYSYADFEKRKNGSAFFSGIDAHWAVEMDIMIVEGQKNLLKKGEKITFVVHSPIKDLGIPENEAAGKEVILELHVIHQENNTIIFNIYPHLKDTIPKQ